MEPHKIIVGGKKKKKLNFAFRFFNEPRKAVELMKILVMSYKFWKWIRFLRV